jgi:endonuclease VIII
MPEGDTLYRIANTLRPRLVGKVVCNLQAPRLSLPPGYLVGSTVRDVAAHGKYLVIDFSADIALLTHLRMDGIWHAYAEAERFRRPQSAVRILIDVGSTVAVCFSAPIVRFVRSAQLAAAARSLGLGPDILAPSFDVSRAAQNVREAGGTPLGEAILDQARVAGIGNVYKSELCFHARINPFAAAGAFSATQLASLLTLTREVMQLNVAASKVSRERSAAHFAPHYLYDRSSAWAVSAGLGVSAGVQRTTVSGCEVGKGRIFVYGRRHEPCFACGAKLQMRRQGDAQRSTYYCAACQQVE